MPLTNLATLLEQLESQYSETYRILGHGWAAQNTSPSALPSNVWDPIHQLWNQAIEDRNLQRGVGVYLAAVACVTAWEAQGDLKVSKGIPYYWLGSTLLTMGDIDTGMSYLHQAVEEDKANAPTQYRSLPAWQVVTHGELPHALAAFTRLHLFFFDFWIGVYSKTRSRSLSRTEFRAFFNLSRDLEDATYLVAWTAVRHIRLLYLKRDLKSNPMINLQMARNLADLSLLYEIVLRHILDHEKARGYTPQNPRTELHALYKNVVVDRLGGDFDQASFDQYGHDWKDAGARSRVIEQLNTAAAPFQDATAIQLTRNDVHHSLESLELWSDICSTSPDGWSNYEVMMQMGFNALCWVIEEYR